MLGINTPITWTVYLTGKPDAIKRSLEALTEKLEDPGRSDFIRAVGVDQAAELRRSGSAYAVVEVDIKYRKPARLSDDLLVISKVHQVRASSVHIQQRVIRGHELLTDATVTAAFLDGEGRPRRQPGDWLEKFQAIITQER